MKLMIAEEFASTGAVEISLFQRLSLGNGTNPCRLAPCPVDIWLQALGRATAATASTTSAATATSTTGASAPAGSATAARAGRSAVTATATEHQSADKPEPTG